MQYNYFKKERIKLGLPTTVVLASQSAALEAEDEEAEEEEDEEDEEAADAADPDMPNGDGMVAAFEKQMEEQQANLQAELAEQQNQLAQQLQQILLTTFHAGNKPFYTMLYKKVTGNDADDAMFEAFKEGSGLEDMLAEVSNQVIGARGSWYSGRAGTCRFAIVVGRIQPGSMNHAKA